MYKQSAWGPLAANYCYTQHNLNTQHQHPISEYCKISSAAGKLVSSMSFSGFICLYVAGKPNASYVFLVSLNPLELLISTLLCAKLCLRSVLPGVWSAVYKSTLLSTLSTSLHYSRGRVWSLERRGELWKPWALQNQACSSILTPNTFCKWIRSVASWWGPLRFCKVRDRGFVY